MPDDNPLAERGRSLEEEYFRKKDRELIEKMRRAAAADTARQGLQAKTGLQDPELVAELEALGFTPDTVVLLPLVPLIQVAWAEGGVTDAERKLITDLARKRGVAQGDAADRQLAEWLSHRPSDDVFARVTRLVRAVLASPTQQGAMSGEELVKLSEDIANASGGVFGLKRISAEERALLTELARALKPSA
jgi:hypothetical protein